MSKLKNRGAIAEIQGQGEMLPEIKKTVGKKKIEELNRQEREKISTTILPSTKVYLTRLQEDAQLKGWKKPKIGELIDEAIRTLSEQRKII